MARRAADSSTRHFPKINAERQRCSSRWAPSSTRERSSSDWSTRTPAWRCTEGSPCTTRSTHCPVGCRVLLRDPGSAQQAMSPSKEPAGYWTSATTPPLNDLEVVHHDAACDTLDAPATQFGTASAAPPAIVFHWK